LESESKSHPEEYLKWYKDFHIYLKEGLHSDQENSELLLSLSRYDSTFASQITLDDYIEKMKPGQKSIYYFLAPQKEAALYSPYMEPFTKNDVPVLYISVNIEEMIFRQLNEYKKFNFINIETAEAELPKDLIKEEKDVAISKEKLPEQDTQLFSMWIKNELQPVVSNVLASKRLTDSPAVVVSSMSTGMRQIITMMDQQNLGEASKNLTFEFNPNHPIIVSLNRLRKSNLKMANFNLRQLLDNCLLSAGIPFDQKHFISRVNEYILQNLQTHEESSAIATDAESGEQLEVTGTDVLNEAMKQTQKFKPSQNEGEIEIEVNEQGEPILKSKK